MTHYFYMLAKHAIIPFVIMVTLAATACSRQKPDVRTRAIELSINIISNSLSVPSAAKFLSETCEIKKDGIIFVTGKIDAQNQYGAMIRSDWMCILTNENQTQLECIVYNVGNQYTENPKFETNEPAKSNP